MILIFTTAAPNADILAALVLTCRFAPAADFLAAFITTGRFAAVVAAAVIAPALTFSPTVTSAWILQPAPSLPLPPPSDP